MEKVEIIMEPDRETKRTWRFRALSDDEVVDTVYLAKRAFRGGEVPKRIRVTVVVDG